MSASTPTHSFRVRLMGKRPASMAGWTPSMMTRFRPVSFCIQPPPLLALPKQASCQVGRWEMGDGRWEMEDGKNLPHLPEGRGGIGRCPRQGDGKRRPLSGATLNRDLSSMSGDDLLHNVQS